MVRSFAKTFQESLGVDGRSRTRNGKPQSAVGYMSLHQHDINAMPLWTYFQSVLRWAMDTFNIKKFKKIMKGLDWAKFYDEYHEKVLDIKEMEKQIIDLIGDDEIQNSKASSRMF